MAARLHVEKGRAFIPRMTPIDGLVGTEGEADDQFVIPMPHAVVGGPTGKAPRLTKNGDLSRHLGLQTAHHLTDLAEMIGAMHNDAQHGRQFVDSLPILSAIEMPFDALVSRV